MDAPRARPRLATWTQALPIGVLLLAFALTIYFDLQSSLPLNDEWLYRWPLQRLLSGHGIQLWPSVQPLALPQLAAAFPLAALHLDPRLWRLTVIPFLLLLSAAGWTLARHLGATRGRAALAAAAVPAAPLTLSVAVGLMSDIAYLGLMLTAAGCAVVWVERGRAIAWTVVLGCLATLERQHGAGIAVGTTVALLLRPGGLDRRDYTGLASLWLVTVGAVLMPFAAGIASTGMRGTLTSSALPHLVPNTAGTLIEAPLMLGLLTLPLGGVLLSRPRGERGPSRSALLAVAWATVAIVGAATFALLYGTMVFPGDQFGNWGLGPLHLSGRKEPLWPLAAFLALEGMVAVMVFVLLVRRRGAWRQAAASPGGLFVIVLAATQLFPMLFTSATDRYHLAVAAPLVPLLVSPRFSPLTAAHRETLAASFSALLLGLGVLLFVAGEQDYQAWETARHAAAQSLYRDLPAAEVDAGYEENAGAIAEPVLAATGRLPIGLNGLSLALPTAKWRLEFASRDDPRAGVTYHSIASGKIVIVPAR